MELPAVSKERRSRIAYSPSDKAANSYDYQKDNASAANCRSDNTEHIKSDLRLTLIPEKGHHQNKGYQSQREADCQRKGNDRKAVPPFILLVFRFYALDGGFRSGGGRHCP